MSGIAPAAVSPSLPLVTHRLNAGSSVSETSRDAVTIATVDSVMLTAKAQEIIAKMREKLGVSDSGGDLEDALGNAIERRRQDLQEYGRKQSALMQKLSAATQRAAEKFAREMPPPYAVIYDATGKPVGEIDQQGGAGGRWGFLALFGGYDAFNALLDGINDEGMSRSQVKAARFEAIAAAIKCFGGRIELTGLDVDPPRIDTSETDPIRRELAALDKEYGLPSRAGA